MKKTKTVTRIDRDVISVTCNKCEKECFDARFNFTDGETFYNE